MLCLLRTLRLLLTCQHLRRADDLVQVGVHDLVHHVHVTAARTARRIAPTAMLSFPQKA